MSATSTVFKIAQVVDLLTVSNLRLVFDRIIKMLALPGFGVLVFLMLWQLVANNIITVGHQLPEH